MKTTISKRCLIIFLGVLIISMIFPSAGFTQIPRIINYQGYLTDLTGVADGTRQMTFAIYDVETDGTALWAETQSVNVNQGVYSVLLGADAGNPFPLTLDFSDQYYLGVQVETDGEMTPRQQLASVPYALNSGNVSNNVVTTNKIADGAVTDIKIGGLISSAKIESAGLDADTLDGMDAADFGDGHSLDAADGNPVDAVYVNNAGNVGIGTTSPSSTLHVEGIIKANTPGTSTGSVTLSGPNGNPGIGLFSNEPEGYRANIARATTGLGIGVHADTTNPGINELFIANDGNVGIGTNNPSDILTVQVPPANDNYVKLIGRSGQDAGLKINHGAVYKGFIGYDGTNDNFAVVNDTGGGIVVDDATGRVGIGTPNPGFKLEVNGDAKITGGDISFWNVATNTALSIRQNGSRHAYITNRADYLGNGADLAGKLILEGNEGIQLRYGGNGSTSPTAALAVDSFGNVGIGTTSPGEVLTVAGTIESTSGGIKFPDGTQQTTECTTKLCDLYTLTGHSKPNFCFECSDGIDNDGDGSVDYPVDPDCASARDNIETSAVKIVFLTSTAYNGNLGGVAGADLKCQNHANAAGLSGIFKAWISTNATDPSRNFTHSSGPYVRTDGRRIAYDWSDLISNGLLLPLSYTELNTWLIGEAVWTNTYSNGNNAADSNCNDWSSDTGVGTFGSSDRTDRNWSFWYFDSKPCNEPQHLYCFEQ